MFPEHRVIELVRRGHLTPAEGAEVMALNRAERWLRKLEVAGFIVELALFFVVAVLLLITVGCGPVADPPPSPDAGVTADPPREPPPMACLPWPCPDGGAP